MHNDAKYFAGNAPQLETKQREAHLSAYVDEAIRQALRDQPAELHNNSTALYHRSFPIGVALADIFTHRAVRDDGLTSLTYLIETLTGLSIPDETPEQQARRALLCGFCWEIVGLLRAGANGGFAFAHKDEGRALMRGVRNGRNADAEMICAMASEDDEW